jgi:hypothetical protein
VGRVAAAAVFGRLAGYEDVNDADRLCRDPAMRWVVGGKAPWIGWHGQLRRPWYARFVGGAAARVGKSFARLLCCPLKTERGRKKAPWVR